MVLGNNRILEVKYIFLCLFFIELVISKEKAGIIVVVLLAIISSNIRKFYLDKEILKLGSIFIELLVVLGLSIIIEFKIGFYLISSISDLFYFEKSIRRKLLGCFIIISFKDIGVFN